MNTDGTLRLATRGSELALRQSTGVRDALASRRREVELVQVETEGDRVTDELIHTLGRTGAFVRALDERVLEGDVDAAVHSLKDMPTEFPEELVVAGVPERAAAGDVLVTPDGSSLDDLPPGAVVGTSSLRRRAQALRARPDIEVEPLRGNVDTRIEKLLAPTLQREHERRMEAESDEKGNAGDDDFEAEYDRSTEEWFDSLSEIQRRALGREVDVEYDGVVLSEAGLRRIGLLDRVETVRLPTREFVPAAGQGAIAVTASDPEVVDAVRKDVDHPRTRVETTVERTVLAELNGGCIAPIGVHAVVQGEYVHVDAQVFGPDGEELVQSSRDLPIGDYLDEAVAFAAALRDRGAGELVEAARAAEER